MLDRPPLVTDESTLTSYLGLAQQTLAEKQRLNDGEDSRVSTDSDLDLETEDEDDCRSTFSYLLMRKLVAIELAQQQQAFQEDRLARTIPLQLLAANEDSYWAKMRRVSQWRESTLHSEAQSGNQSDVPSEGSSEASSNYSPPAATTRKRSLSNASHPTDFKRARLTALSPAPPGSPFCPRARAFPVPLSLGKASDLGAYSDVVQLRVKSYSSLALHVCSACDTSFVSRQRLRHHGHGAWTPDACRAAVTYGLE